MGVRFWPNFFPKPAVIDKKVASESVVDAMMANGELSHTQPSISKAVHVILVGILLWFGPLIILGLLFGSNHVFVKQGLFFSQAAVVTFGGAYAVLAYVAQQAVTTYSWLQPGEMLDGLGLAETTPGPLILVLQFVGFLAAFRHAGDL